MKKLISTIAMFAVAVASFAQSGFNQSSVTGTYRLKISEETKNVVRLMGMPTPSARLTLYRDGSFTFVSAVNGLVRDFGGQYRQDAGSLKLKVGNNEISALLEETGQLKFEGLDYLREAEEVKASPMSAPASIILPIAAAPTKTLSQGELAGTWTLRKNGAEDRSIRFIFGLDGSFKFAGMNSVSKGKFVIEGGKMTLLWAEVDGVPVEPGSIKKVINFFEDGSFRIDSFRYLKA